MAIVDLILLAAALLLLVPSLVVLVELVAAAWAGLPARIRSTSRPRIAVVVPAHNEEIAIRSTLLNIKQQLGVSDRMVLVADNCSDATAEIAVSAGAEVVARNDPGRRGKAYAVAWGLRHLQANPPDVVVIVDADCELSVGCLAQIGAEALESGMPVQAHYQLLFSGQRRAPPLTLTAFAFKVKNTLRPTGLRNLGLPCQLMGTGMAFPWPLVANRDLGSGELAEDLVWGLQFAQAGRAPRFCLAATVTSVAPQSTEGQATQRARWETGHLATIYRRVPALLLDAVARGNLPQMALALDAAVPPLALHALCVFVLALLTAISVLFGGSVVPLVIAAVSIAGLSVTLVLACLSGGKDELTISDIVAIPAYALSKLSLYAQIFMGRHGSWIRTKRDRS
jgi:cellulose synthase/poly-beta-1,6-N-acetylglucosamine synthase-like glycosyltransferase